MLRKIICLLGAACVVLSVGVTATAAEHLGAVTVTPVWAGRPVTGGTVQLFRVGSAVAEGFQLTDGLANWIVKEEEGTNRELLNRLAENVEEGLCSTVEETGAQFAGLTEGVYLITQREAAEGYDVFSPFLVQLPAGDSWEIAVRPQTVRDSENPQTGDHPAPIIGAMGLGLSAAVLMVLVDERKK